MAVVTIYGYTHTYCDTNIRRDRATAVFRSWIIYRSDGNIESKSRKPQRFRHEEEGKKCSPRGLIELSEIVGFA